MSFYTVIAIDGPAASGKSSAGLKLAQRLGFLFFDTGIMYRVVTWAVLDKGMDIYDEKKVGGLANEVVIDVKPPSIADGRANDVLLDGKDVTLEIRNPQVNQNVSQISTYAKVREAMTLQQRAIASKCPIVMAGRDIGTVVLPDADFKFYLEASIKVRAERRKQEVGEDISMDEIIQGIIQRDEIDSTRVIAPLKPAADAIIINTDKLTLEQVVEKMYQMIMKGDQKKKDA